MTKRKRIGLTALLILFILILIGTIVFWLVLRQQFLSGYDEGVKTLKAQGYEITAPPLTVSGFPFFIDTQTQDLTIIAPKGDYQDSSKNWSLKTSALSLSSFIYSPWSWRVIHNGDLQVDMRTPVGQRYLVNILTEAITVNTSVDFKGQLKSVAAQMEPTTIEPVIGQYPYLRSLDALRFDTKVRGGDGYFNLALDNVILDDQIPAELTTFPGLVVDHFSVDGVIKDFQNHVMASATSSVQPDIHINIDPLTLIWGPVDVICQADLTQSGTLLNGQVRLEFAEIGKLLDAIGEAQLIPQENFQMVSMGLRSIPPNEDGRTVLVFPIQNNQLMFMGQVIADLSR